MQPRRHGFGVSPARCRDAPSRPTTVGILAIVALGTATSFDLFGFRLALPDRRENDGDCSAFLAEHRARFGFLLDTLAERLSRARVGRETIASGAGDLQGRARISRTSQGAFPGTAASPSAGRSICPNVRLSCRPNRSAASARPRHSLDRPDIVQALGRDFGNYTFNAGMLQGWRAPFKIGGEIRLVAFDGEAAYALATRSWEAAPIEPASFARWAFELPTPVDCSPNGWRTMTAPSSRRSIARDRRRGASRAGEIHTYRLAGRPAEVLDHRAFVRALRFHAEPDARILEDAQIRQQAELIYVIDDPRIVSDVDPAGAAAARVLRRVRSASS